MPDYREVYEHHADRYDVLVSHEDHEGNLARALSALTGDGLRKTAQRFKLLSVRMREGEEWQPAIRRVLRVLLQELPTKAAARLAAQITGETKNALYERALQIKGEISL